MNISEARIAFSTQRSGAKSRGIEWKLSFEQWLAWWGSDLGQRGAHRGQLQMQRFHDKGAYELGNIKKGTPKENMKTSGNCRRSMTSLRDHARLQKMLDEAPPVDKIFEKIEVSEDEIELHRMVGMRRSSVYG